MLYFPRIQLHVFLFSSLFALVGAGLLALSLPLPALALPDVLKGEVCEKTGRRHYLGCMSKGDTQNGIGLFSQYLKEVSSDLSFVIHNHYFDGDLDDPVRKEEQRVKIDVTVECGLKRWIDTYEVDSDVVCIVDNSSSIPQDMKAITLHQCSCSGISRLQAAILLPDNCAKAYIVDNWSLNKTHILSPDKLYYEQASCQTLDYGKTYECKMGNGYSVSLSIKISLAYKSCNICMDRPRMTRLGCGHVLCDKCTKEQLKKNKLCPICRKSICKKKIEQLPPDSYPTFIRRR